MNEETLPKGETRRQGIGVANVIDDGYGTDRGYVDGWDTWTSLEEVFRS